MKVVFKVNKVTLHQVIEAIEPHLEFWRQKYSSMPEIDWNNIPNGYKHRYQLNSSNPMFDTTGINKYGILSIDENNATVTLDGNRSNLSQIGIEDAVRVLREHKPEIIEYTTAAPDIKWHETAHMYLARKVQEVHDNKGCTKTAVRDASAYLYEKCGMEEINTEKAWFSYKPEPNTNDTVLEAVIGYLESIGIEQYEDFSRWDISCKKAAADKRAEEEDLLKWKWKWKA